MKAKTWDYLKKELAEFAKDNEEKFNREKIVSYINPPKKSSGSFARMTSSQPHDPRKFLVARKSTMEKSMEVLAEQIKKGGGAERRMSSWRLQKIQAIYVKHYGDKNGKKSS